jgi:hypothetical protein
VSVKLELPAFARPIRGILPGDHGYLAFLPRIAESPALARIGNAKISGSELVKAARVQIRPERSYCWVDVDVPCIVLAQNYYETGTDLDLYLDLLHELTHVRQHHEGRDLWDSTYAYHRRPTEIEGYAVAVEEGRRLGMSEDEIVVHLSNPWMSPTDVRELLAGIDRFLAR